MYLKFYLSLLIGILLVNGSNAQEKFTISGYIEDASSGEKLLGANVIDLISLNGNSTNNYGFYSITLPKDSVTLTFSYIGYQSQTKSIFLDKNINLNIKLTDESTLDEIEVVSNRAEAIEKAVQMSQVDIPVEQIKKLPALLGEVDVLKTLQLLPGVQSGGEGQNGLYVRGGSPDQNLILMDGVPVYNVSHLLGIFSVFNADAIKNVTLTKGGFPARYGGRLSSVLEINLKEGNTKEFHGEGSIGLISSKIAFEGPIKKDKTSFIVSARRTYADLVFGPIVRNVAKKDGIDLKTKLYFYDINGKLQHKINDKHRLFFSIYSGADVFSNSIKDGQTTNDVAINWGNVISALRWNYEINNKLFLNTTLTYSDYEIDFLVGYGDESDDNFEKFSAKYVSGIEDWAAKFDFDYIPTPNHYIKFGANATRHRYRPGALQLRLDTEGDDFNQTIGAQELTSEEYSIYLEDDMKFGNFKANLGVHASGFSIGDKFYTSVQPRLGMRYLFQNNVALKGAFSTMTQYINLLTSEALSLPTDLWVPSTELIKPQTSWQAALGLAKTFKKTYEVSAEVFYKKMDNVVSYKEGTTFINGFGADWQTKITQGTGEAYGLELFLQKKKGNTTGWIGYTLAWNTRQFPDINSGEKYPFRYDRRHDLSVVVSHKINEKISLSGAWVYGTGNAISLPVARYRSDNFEELEVLGDKNAFRMSDYHRLDLSIEFSKKKKRYERKWIIGVYNSYWNKNPYYATLENGTNSEGEATRQLREISILPLIPSVSYAFKF